MIIIKASDNEVMHRAYEQTRNAGNTRLDLNEAIRDEDVKPIAETLRKLGITEFTISAGSFAIIRTLAAFEKLGIKMAGIINVNSRFGESIPAFLMKVE